jgi:hypothetical protein
MAENGDLKTLINKQLKIQNSTGSRVVSAMGKVSSETLGALFIRVKNPANALFLKGQKRGKFTLKNT